jgi:hypothetical protein
MNDIKAKIWGTIEAIDALERIVEAMEESYGEADEYIIDMLDSLNKHYNYLLRDDYPTFEELKNRSKSAFPMCGAEL